MSEKPSLNSSVDSVSTDDTLEREMNAIFNSPELPKTEKSESNPQETEKPESNLQEVESPELNLQPNEELNVETIVHDVANSAVNESESKKSETKVLTLPAVRRSERRRSVKVRYDEENIPSKPMTKVKSESDIKGIEQSVKKTNKRKIRTDSQDTDDSEKDFKPSKSTKRRSKPQNGVKIQHLELKHESEEVKSEPKDVNNEPEEVKNESTDVNSESIVVKSEPEVVKSESTEVKSEPEEVKNELEEVKSEPDEVKSEPEEVKSEHTELKNETLEPQIEIKEEPVSQPPKRKAALNKSFAEPSDSDDEEFHNNELKPPKRKKRKKSSDYEEEVDSGEDFKPDSKSKSPKKRTKNQSGSPDKKVSNNNLETSKSSTKSLQKREFFSRGDIILVICKKVAGNEQGVKNEKFDPIIANMRLCVATKDSYYHYTGKRWMTDSYELIKGKFLALKHELVYAFHEDDPRIQHYIDFHSKKNPRFAETLNSQLELYKSVEALNLDTEEKISYFKGDIELPKSEPKIEIDIPENTEEEKVEKPIAKAKNVIKYFRNNIHIKTHLRKICSGEIKSERHNLANLGRFGVNSDLENMANFAFLENDEDLDHELYVEAEKILQENNECFRDSDGTFKEKYCKFVLIPEGIIFYLIRAQKMNSENAQKYYLEFKNTETVVKDEEPEQPDNYNQHMLNNIEPKCEPNPDDEIPDLSDLGSDIGSDVEEIS